MKWIISDTSFPLRSDMNLRFQISTPESIWSCYYAATASFKRGGDTDVKHTQHDKHLKQGNVVYFCHQLAKRPQ